jgi:transketolase
MKFVKKPKDSYFKLSNCIRVLAADAVEKAHSGHPGMVLGMADVMTSLVFNFLRFNPNDPKWFNRDRLILSAGHGSMLLYAFYYLTGYKDFDLDDIKHFRQLHSKTPGHPEYHAYQAIETSTGPLGQGFGNAVGMAIAEKKYQQKLGRDICDYKIYCIVGDGCLMEGISYEVASLAGHLKLNNLIVLFDDNKISIDGKTSLTISEDHLTKFTALGWNVDSIDGHDFEAIEKSLEKAQNSDKPHFIACNTLIGKGCANKAGSELSHGSPLGTEEIKLLKQNLGVQDGEFCIPEELLQIWRKAWVRYKELYDDWHKTYENLTNEHKGYIEPPIINNSLFNGINYTNSQIKLNINNLNGERAQRADVCEHESSMKNAYAPVSFGIRYCAIKDQATRTSSGLVIEELLKVTDKIICGSADLSISNNIKNTLSSAITAKDFNGNFIHYGTREHGMAAIMNGLALSGFLPIGGTFFVFSDYMKPSIRLAAIMNIHVIYVMTHDSIGVGEDGPTHQPIEHLAGMRAMPNLLVLRPADCIETIECWNIALTNKTGPSMLILTRQNVTQIRKTLLGQNLCAKGAYIVSSNGDYEEALGGSVDVALYATGSELSLAQNTRNILNKLGVSTRVVSIPSFELFFQQSETYIKTILTGARIKVAIEAASNFGWHRIIGENGMFFGIDRFGLSAPSTVLFEHFGLNVENIVSQIKERLETL